MAAKASENLIKLFDDENVAAQFGRGFLSAYLIPALGVLSKSEIDLRVFTLLIEVGAINPNGPIFGIARALNITPAKARSLLFQYQLRHVGEAETERAVLTTIANAQYWKDGSNLAFGVESPLVRNALAAKMRERGVFSDISLSGDILKVSPDQFGDVIASLLPPDVASQVVKKLKKQGVNEGAVRKAIKKYGLSVAEDFIKDEAKTGLKDFLGWVGQGAIENGPNVIEFFSDVVDGLT